MNKLLLSSIRYFVRHPSQLLLSVLGVTLGVGLMVAVDSANQSSSKAFDLSMETLLGKTTHHIIGSPEGINDSIYFNLRNNHNFKNITPIIEDYASIETNITKTFTLFGIDPFTEQPFRPIFYNIAKDITGDARQFLLTENSVIMSQNSLNELGLSIGESFQIRLGGNIDTAIVIGIFSTENNAQSAMLDNILVCDISSAQTMLIMKYKISRIDLLIDENSEEYKNLSELLPTGLQIVNANSRSQAVENMSNAFKLNLTAMSFLALLVGMFLIYNTITFSVVQRRKLLGLFRTIGVTRKEIFLTVMLEAIILGIIGTSLGIMLGLLISDFLINMVTQTINDLYYVLSVKELSFNYTLIIKAGIAGLLATLLSAMHPAWEATRAMTVNTLQRSDLEKQKRKKIPITLLIAILCFALSIIAFSVNTHSIYLGFGAYIPLVIGFTMLTPVLIIMYVKLCSPFIKKIFGSNGAIAIRGLYRNMSRTTIAVAALAIAVAASIGVATMVKSFRTTVVYWLETRLTADAYVSAPSLISRKNQAIMQPEIAEKLRKLPEVKSLNVYREIDVFYEGRYHTILAGDRKRESDGTYTFKKGDNFTAWTATKERDAVIISEPYEYHYNVTLGDFITLPTIYGEKKFEIVGVFYDYSSDMGLVVMNLEKYREYFDDKYISGISINANENVSTDSLLSAIRNAIPSGTELIVMSNRKLLDSSIEIFDRTFIITNLLQFLAIGVAFIGILSSFMALQLEKYKEFAVMRALGMTPGQLKRQIVLQTSQMGVIAGLISIPLGNIFALILIHVINKRSFGWSLQFDFAIDINLQAIILAVLASILAAIYPAFKISKVNPSVAMREE